MSDVWRLAAQRSQEFDATAAAYDRYRPRYPEPIFDDIVELGELQPGDIAIEIGAGTGIATLPLVGGGLQVTAIEPAPSMAAVARGKLGNTANFVVGRFEDLRPGGHVDLIAAFNAWHWVEPVKGVDLAAQLLRAGGTLALVWTEIISWGQDDFGQRLAAATGAPWPEHYQHVPASMEPVRADERFDDIIVRRHRFDRVLTADDFVAVTRTYGGPHTDERDQQIRQVIDQHFDGTVTKTEEAVLYITRRCP